MRFSLELSRDDLSGLWIAEVPQLAGVRVSAFERVEAMARVRALAIAVVLDRYFTEHDTAASERMMVELLDLRCGGAIVRPAPAEGQLISAS